MKIITIACAILLAATVAATPAQQKTVKPTAGKRQETQADCLARLRSQGRGRNAAAMCNMGY